MKSHLFSWWSLKTNFGSISMEWFCFYQVISFKWSDPSRSDIVKYHFNFKNIAKCNQMFI